MVKIIYYIWELVIDDAVLSVAHMLYSLHPNKNNYGLVVLAPTRATSWACPIFVNQQARSIL